MSERQTNINSLFLNEDSAKRSPADNRVQRFQKAVRKRAGRAKKSLSSISRQSVQSFFKKNAFVLLTIFAVILGIILGFTLRRYKLSYREIKYFSFPGELLMRMLQMLVLPLIVSSLVSGMAALDSKASGKMGIRAVVFYMVTTVIAVFIGIVMVMIIHPGKGSKVDLHREGKIEQVQAADAFMDLIRNMFPPNLVEACFKQYKTNYDTRKVMITTSSPINLTTSTEPSMMDNITEAFKKLQELMLDEEVIPIAGSANAVNALGLVVFSIAFGLVIGNMKQKGRALKEFFDCLNEAIMRLVAIII
ncbi:hypothetical protein scyTo_0006198, partial [Scyliorhinus torazame]|nr:hypothetical protein [Scyliorhinus torazame]